MILVLFHVLCLFGKFVYRKYQNNNKCKDFCGTMQHVELSAADKNNMFRLVDPECADEDDEENRLPIKFYPPLYMQRYSTVSDILSDPKYRGKLRKIVDFGCGELSFVTHLKGVSGVEEILCVDVDGLLLENSKAKAEPLILEYVNCRPSPLVIEICQGSVTDSDTKLEGADAVVCIELIEHLYPDTLMDLPFNIFGFIKPKVVVVTTPNVEFNVLFGKISGFRHYDHKFEWTRQQFQDWAQNIVERYPDYEVTFHGIGHGPEGTSDLGECTQMAVFSRIYELQPYNVGVQDLYKTIASYEYPFKIDNRSDEQKILDEALYFMQTLSSRNEEMQEEVPLDELLKLLQAFSINMETLITILVDGGKVVEYRESGPVVLLPQISASSMYTDYELDTDDTLFDDTLENEDDWDVGIGSVRNHNNEVPGPDISTEDWGNNYWEEPSIVIPQQDYEPQDYEPQDYEPQDYEPQDYEPQDYEPPDNTNFFDGQDNNSIISEAVPIETEGYGNNSLDVEMSYYPSSNIKDISINPALPNILNPDNEISSLDCNVSEVNDSIISIDCSYNTNTENIKEDLCLNDSTTSTVQRLNKMLDLHISHTSTSPEPFLLQDVHRDRMLKDDLCNQSMSAEWMLNNTYHNLDISKDSMANAEHNVDVRMNDATSSEDELTDDVLDMMQSKPSMSINNCLSFNQPGFTSSPKISVKVAAKGNKRKSLVYPISSGNICSQTIPEQLEDVDMIGLRIATSSLKHSSVHVSNTIDCHTSESVLVDDDSTNVQKTDITASSPIIKSRRLNSSEHDVPEVFAESAAYNEVLKKKDYQQVSECVEATISNKDHSLNVIEETANKTESPQSTIATNSSKDAKEVEDSRDSTKSTNEIVSSSILEIDQQKSNLLSSRLVQKIKDRQLSPLKIIGDPDAKLTPESAEPSPVSSSPGVADSGYPNSASTLGMSPEYDLPSIDDDHMLDLKSPSIIEAPPLEPLEVREVDNGDVANNNRDDEGNNMIPGRNNIAEHLQFLINGLEIDQENENDVFALGNDFPAWLLGILERGNAGDIVPAQIQQNMREERMPDPGAGCADNIKLDEGFDSSSTEEEGDSL